MTIGVDGLLGDSIFYVVDDVEYKTKTKDPVCGFVLSSAEAREIALKEYKWILMEQGLRSRRTLTVEKITKGKKNYYPFWIGYYLKGKSYEFKALDAISGQIQGLRMRKVFLKALRQLS